ncbi:N-acetylmuramic acid 6-phosphate etherase [Terriglobus sp. 2YAB30_2]|uniref:N-acetylmuramic acid 6-phosphate etherase n=1 Tax=unclassified Terriglobus TaxID=2628988 RepID=UPI003F9E2A17
MPIDSVQLASIPTESRNPRTTAIDSLPTEEMLRLINREDAAVITAVEAEVPHIAAVLDALVPRIVGGGRLFYIGAGTSGRLGVLDASECPPTFSVPPTLVQGLIAGGDSALRKSSEKSEDSREQGAADLKAADFTSGDTLVGIAASGRTPYVLGAIAWAREIGALTVGLSCVPGSPLAKEAEMEITPLTGPEVLTGSTRMKAGTATKLVLNMLSTGLMIRTGLTYGNLMVNVQPTNEKLVDRAARIIMEITGVDQKTAAELLIEAGSVKVAVVMQKLGLSTDAAVAKLQQAGGRLREALES